MRWYGKIQELAQLIFRKSGFAVTVEPVSASADTVFQLPAAGGGTKSITTADSATTFTNKTFDADASGNSISNIENADIKVGAAIDAAKIHDGTVSNTEFGHLNGVASAILGKDDAGTFTNKTIAAGSNTITGLTKSDVGLGNVDNTSDATKNAAVAALTNKTIDGDLNTLQDIALSSLKTVGGDAGKLVARDGSGAVVSTDSPEATLVEFNSQGSSPSTPAGAGDVRVFAKSDKLYTKNSLGIEAEVGAGVGGINYLSGQFNADALGTVDTSVGDTIASSTRTNPTRWGTSHSSNIITQSTDSTLRGTTNYLVSYSANAQFVESPLFTLDGSDLGKALLVSFSHSGISTSDDVQVYMVRYNSSNVLQERIPLAGTASATTPFSARLNTGVSQLNSFFVSGSTASDKYALRVLRNANATAVRLDSFVVGPQSLAVAPPLTGWENSTGFTYSGFGTVSSQSVQIKRIGDTMSVRGNFTSGTAAASQALIILPSGYHINTSAISATTRVPIFGYGAAYSSAGTVNYSGGGNPFLVTYDGTNSDRVALSEFVSSNSLAARNGNNICIDVSGDILSFQFEIPIAEWAGSANNSIQADRAVEEYAYTTESFDASGTTTAYGPSGQAITALTNDRSKTITWRQAIQPTDSIVIEGSRDGLYWAPMQGFNFSSGAVINGVDSGGGYSGVTWHNTSSTQTVVTFYSFMNRANDDAPPTNWPSSNAYWRVRKISGGALVGYPLSSANLYDFPLSNATGTAAITGGTTSPTQTVYVTRTGNIVTISLPANTQVTKSGSGTFTFPTIIPSGYLPAATQATRQYYSVNSSPTVALIFISSAGTITFYKDKDGNSFANGETFQIEQALTFSYSLQ